jgi:Xaa-Pro aminopeptidase
MKEWGFIHKNPLTAPGGALPLEIIDSMRYQPLHSSLFTANRKRFAAQLPPGSLAVLVASDQVPSNGDAYYPYKPDSNLYWLTGIDQEQTALILFPDCPNPAMREVLFVRETSPQLAVWEGPRHSLEAASSLSGIQQVLWHKDFEATLWTQMKYATNCFLTLNENDRASKSPVLTASQRFSAQIQADFPLHRFHRASPILDRLRSVKQEQELTAIQKAIEITHQAFLMAIKALKPGLKEYQVEAALAGSIWSQGAEGFSFEPIMASGAHACILHYTQNDGECKDGELMLMDFGANYAHYAADLTRCVPVNGRFTARQKEVYDAVLHVQRQSMALLTVGRSLDQYNQESALLMQDALLSLGLITKKDIQEQNPAHPAYKKYFPHGTGHFLGIDVHDVGARFEPLQAGMLITCEPGIYIPEEGLGIRIENDILVTESGPIDLMSALPIHTEEIEEAYHA